MGSAGRGGSGCWRGLEAGFNPSPTALQGLPSAGEVLEGHLCHRAAPGWPRRSEAAPSLPPLSARSPPLQATISVNAQIVFLSLEKTNKGQRTSRAAVIH